MPFEIKKLGTKNAKCIFFLYEIGTRQETSCYLIVYIHYPFLPFKHFIHCSVEHTCQEDLYLRIQNSSSAASATITSLKWSKNETNCSYLFWIMHPTTYRSDCIKCRGYCKL